MKVQETKIPGVCLIEPEIKHDSRGMFIETYRKDQYAALQGREGEFLQDNFSLSHKGVLRGMHFQPNNPQGKLVRCSLGRIYDVVVDIRKDSSTFGEWYGTELNGESHRQLWVPEGLAHGFLTLSETAQIEYKCTNYYDPTGQECLLWNDPAIGINWEQFNLDIRLSEKDAVGKTLENLIK